MIADKRAYAPGDTARLVIRGETIGGPMLITKEGQHVLWHQLLRPAAGEAIAVPVEAGDVGDVYVHIAFMRDGRLYRAERRLGSARGFTGPDDYADGRPRCRQTAGTGRLLGQRDRRRRRAGAARN